MRDSQRSNHPIQHAALAMWRVLAALLFFSLASSFSTPARAGVLVPGATYTVTKTADTADGACNSDCSLREAVLAANAASGADTIVVPAGVYNLTRPGVAEDAAATGDLDLTGTVTITGAGASTTVIDGQAADRVFHVLAGATVTISGVTVRNGLLADVGGGILNAGTLTLNDSIVSGNQATGGNAGGGIGNRGVLTMNNSTLLANVSTFGGGMYSEASGPAVAMNNSTLRGNQAEFGGGMYSKNGTVGITATVLISNTANNSGGAIDNFTGSTMTLFASTVRENTAAVYGGGIYVEYGEVTVNSSAVISNSVSSLGNVYGGGIYNWGINLTVTDSTIGGNSALADNTCGVGACTTSYTSYGGGIFNNSPMTLINSTLNRNSAAYRSGPSAYTAGVGAGLNNQFVAHVKNTIIANSQGYPGLEAANCAFLMAPISDGHNLDSGYTCGLATATDKVSIDPLLGSLHTYGSTPPVYPLQSGSQAIDAGDNTGCPAADQRGFTRPFDGDANGSATCDIGAFEYGYYAASVAVASSVNPSVVGQNVTFTATLSSAKGTPTGTVTFRDGSTVICSAVSVTAGKATCAVAFTGPGVHAITAMYGGDDWFSASTGTLSGGQTVNPGVFKLHLPLVVR